MVTRALTRMALAGLFLLWTWLWLLPLSGFHHMFRCGVLGWAILDGEDAGFTVRWSLLALALSLAGWLGGVVAAWALRRALRATGGS